MAIDQDDQRSELIGFLPKSALITQIVRHGLSERSSGIIATR